jgi:hypothetical protein
VRLAFSTPSIGINDSKALFSTKKGREFPAFFITEALPHSQLRKIFKVISPIPAVLYWSCMVSRLARKLPKRLLAKQTDPH